MVVRKECYSGSSAGVVNLARYVRCTCLAVNYLDGEKTPFHGDWTLKNGGLTIQFFGLMGETLTPLRL